MLSALTQLTGGDSQENVYSWGIIQIIIVHNHTQRPFKRKGNFKLK